MVVVVVYCCPPAATTGRFGVIELTAAAVRWRAVVTPLDADSRLLKTIINVICAQAANSCDGQTVGRTDTECRA